MSPLCNNNNNNHEQNIQTNTILQMIAYIDSYVESKFENHFYGNWEKKIPLIFISVGNCFLTIINFTN